MYNTITNTLATTHTRAKPVATAWILFSALGFFLYSIANPHINWDMLAYSAAAEALLGNDPVDTHARLYADLQERATADEFERITNETAYRQVMHSDANAFQQQLPYYQSRIVFISAIALAKRLGLHTFDAGHWLSAAALTLGLIIFWLTFRALIHPILLLSLPAFYVLYSERLDIACSVLSDSFAFMWIALISLALFRRSLLLFPLLISAVLVRPDLALLSVLILAGLWLTTKTRRSPLALTMLLTVTIYLLINQYYGNYGWQALFYFVFITDMSATNPEIYQQEAVSIAQYIYHLRSPEWVSKMFFLTALLWLASTAIWLKLTSIEKRKIANTYLLSCAAEFYIPLHYLTFPELLPRFFIAENLIVTLAFLALTTILINRSANDSAPQTANPD